MDIRGELTTQLVKSILGLGALDRMLQTQCSMAIGPLNEGKVLIDLRRIGGKGKGR